MFAVKDSGIGIPADALKKIFEMFSQVKSARDRSEGGLGIGLSLTKGLVDLHGGRIEAHSAGPGHGSEFVVRLPRRDSRIEPAVGPAPVDRERGASRRVLIADDNQDAAETLAMLLQIEGHQVHVVHDGRAAVSAFVDFNPDVALLDIGMPELSGYEVAKRVREDLQKAKRDFDCADRLGSGSGQGAGAGGRIQSPFYEAGGTRTTERNTALAGDPSQ